EGLEQSLGLVFMNFHIPFPFPVFVSTETYGITKDVWVCRLGQEIRVPAERRSPIKHTHTTQVITLTRPIYQGIPEIHKKPKRLVGSRGRFPKKNHLPE